MHDIGPDEMERRTWIISRIEDTIRRYGFRKVEPSFVEHLDTLTAKSGEAVLGEVYHFKDKGGRDLALRFDLTVGMARMVANSFDLREPIKFYALSPNWRYDEPQYGRYRCFWQWDVETYGVAEPSADAEVVAVGLSVAESAGLDDVVAKLSSRRLLETLLKKAGAADSGKVSYLLRTLDKASKIDAGELRRMVSASGLGEQATEQIVSFGKIKGAYDKVCGELEKAAGPEGSQALAELGSTVDELASLGFANKVEVDLGIVRGLDYYDGVVFEGVDSRLPKAGSLFGGGRYNGLTGLYGKRSLPATGVAGGIERMMLSLEAAGKQHRETPAVSVYVAAASSELRLKAASVCAKLRESGIVAEYPLKDWPLRRQLEYADALGRTHVMVVGKREIESHLYTLKALKSGEQRQLTLEDTIRELSSINR
ncbi:MAG: histidine--tRNA ligase [Thermoprotei archaeon]